MQFNRVRVESKELPRGVERERSSSSRCGVALRIDPE